MPLVTCQPAKSLLAFLVLAITTTASSAPFITRHPASAVVTEDETVVLSVVATGTALRYQWRRNGVDIGGSTAASITVSRVSLGATTYDVLVADSTGATRSNAATVRVESTRLINISTRAQVGAGEGAAMFVGFVVRGNRRSILIRAVGPSLAAFGIDGFLPNPTLIIRDGKGQVIDQNDDWALHASPVVLNEFFSMVGAFPLSSVSSRDAVVQRVLDAGNYTVEVAASASPITSSEPKTGIALVEVYEIP